MYVSNFNRFGKLYRVMMQASPEARVSPETLNNIKIRNGNEMASLSNFVTLKRIYGPDLLNRFNMFQSISVTGQPTPGYSSGDAIAAIERTAAEYLPQGYGYEYAGMTREEANSSSGSAQQLSYSDSVCSSCTCSYRHSTKATSFPGPLSFRFPSDLWARSSLPRYSAYPTTSICKSR